MASNYSFYSFIVNSEINYNVLTTSASNIKLVKFSAPTNLRDTNYYGMNGSFYNTDTNVISNIIYQSGANLGNDNTCGTSLVYWDGSALRYANGVSDKNSSIIPKSSGSWAQGGFGLFLCDTGWEKKFNAQPAAADMGGGSPRCGILVNADTKTVHLFMTSGLAGTVANLRQAMMEFASLKEGDSPRNYFGLMVDGGRSAQMRCNELNGYVPILPRGTMQILSLIKTT